MQKQVFALAAGLTLSAAGLFAQTTVGFAFQQAGAIGTPSGQYIMINMDATGTIGTGPVVASRPLSAKEERKTVQTLSDGTELANSESNLFYRDTLGRTRMEQTGPQGKKIVTIRDPVAGFTARIDPEARAAMKNAIAVGGGRGGRGGSALATFVPDTAENIQKMQADLKKQAEEVQKQATAVATKVAKAGTLGSTEDLGIETVNGVPAVHTRNTQVIPAGQIGNNRDIHVVNDRWYSEDLQMLIKSVNTDPRFGETTYQVTDIVRSDPDPSLFTIPADYTVNEPALRRPAEIVVRKQQ